ncbi:MAG: ABC transporter permease [Vicinamibacteria bacterium]
MSELIRDLRLSVRKLGTQKAHSAVVVLTLGLALGLSALIFSFVSFFVLRPLPVRDEKTMILARSTHPQESNARPRMSYADFVDFRAQTRTVEELVGMAMGTGALTGSGDAQRVSVAAASEGMLRVWDLQMEKGRRFEAREDSASASPVLLVSHGFWERSLGRDPAVVGRILTLDGRPCTVVGVVSAAIEVGRFSEIDVWLPLEQSSPSQNRERRDMTVSGRLKPGATPAQVSTEFATIAARIAIDHPDSNKDWSASAIPMRDGLYGSGTNVILALLVVGVCLVFAVACANVAGIMLARATTREREMALRLSLGASPKAIVRQLVIEGLVLSVLGSALGLLLAQCGLLLMRSVAFEQFYDLVVIDARVIGFSLALTLVAPLLFGLAPALQLAGRQLALVLRDGGASSGTSSRVGRSRRSLVVLQIGLATALLMVSGLSIRAAIVASKFDLGFNTSGLLSVRVDLAEDRYKAPEDVRARTEQLIAALTAAPGVTWAAAGTEIPTLDRTRSEGFSREGDTLETKRRAIVTVGSANYFQTLEVPLLRGRGFLETDAPGTPAIAVVSEALVARAFTGEDAVGRRIQIGGASSPWVEIVGVAKDVANNSLGHPATSQIYLPFAQRPERSLVLFSRTGDAGSALAVLRERMRALDPDQPLYDAKTVDQFAWEELASNRIITGLFVALGAVSLCLAIVGLYGLTAFLVAQRSREIGVRMALGASARDVVRLVVAQGARLTALGLTMGLALGLLLGRAMSSVLVGIKPWDPLTVSSTIATLGIAVLLAHWAPARRAATVNPIDALRQD